MAGKRDGITDLTKVLVMLAERLTPKQYQKVRDVFFSTLNGVTFGYDELDGRFLKDSNDIFLHHSSHNSSRYRGKAKLKKRRGYIAPIPSALKNEKVNLDNVIDFNHYRFWNK